MTIEVDLKEIKSLLSEVNSKFDFLLEKKTLVSSWLWNRNLSRFPRGEI
jgi:hypothetical protein